MSNYSESFNESEASSRSESANQAVNETKSEHFLEKEISLISFLILFESKAH